MITVRVGDLFESEAQTLVNTVNTAGVMGKGIALEFKKRFPEMYDDYVRRCEAGRVKLGEPYLYRNLFPPHVLNFPTKEHWRSASRLEDILRGLQYLEDHYKEWGITSLAVPPLGCGHGQLEWSVVGPALYRMLSRLEIPVELYAPYDTPHEELQPEFLGALPGGAAPAPHTHMKPEWVALVAALARVEEANDRGLGRTAFQALCYFMTALGVPTGLRFVPSRHGLHCTEVRPLLARLENHGLIREVRDGRMIRLVPGETYSDAAEAYEESLRRWQREIGSAAQILSGLTTARQVRAVMAAHAAVSSLESESGATPGRAEILQKIAEQSGLKSRDWEPEIARAIEVLNELDWPHPRTFTFLAQE